MPLDYAEIAAKWQKRWKKAGTYEPEPDSRRGFYIQPAYPYPSGAMHIGHARTYVATDVVCRYKRMSGFNTLFPMGWHVSGTPVISTVELLKEKDAGTVKKMVENFLIPKKDLKELETPKGFVDYFVNKAKTGYKAGFNKLGLGLDWRRELTTMDPQYNKFIEWQYRKLHKKGYLGKGKYPIRYCPKDKSPVGDHDLVEGEGIGITEFTLVKFQYEKPNQYIIAATLRPDALFGQTNMWVNPDVVYSIIKVGEKERWIVSKEAVKKLKLQGKDVKEVGKIKGSEMTGKYCKGPNFDKAIMILPTDFIESNVASGIVYSALETPVDWMAVKEMQQDKEFCKRHKLDIEKVREIKPIPMIKVPGMGKDLGKEICEEFGVKSTEDVEGLQKAKAEIYRRVMYSGTMRENCGKYAGMPASKAKDLIKKELIGKGQADTMYEMEGKAVCRCGTEVVVSVLEDQWFVRYGDGKWKKEAMKTLGGMDTAPELYRQQYEKVFEWLEDKPCTRAKGLGTKFPWDRSKIIEPLGDSTIYMAYFTMSHIIREVPAEKLNDDVFDYVFLGKGSAENLARKNKIPVDKLKAMRKNFDYWYPLAYNVSAIELIPNHMSFSIFQHTAIFPPEKRQLGTLNLGMLVVEGQKMASSKGNVVLIDTIADRLGADMVRFFLMNFNEPWQEVDWKPQEVEKGLRTMNSFIDWAERTCGRAKDAGELHIKGLSDAERWLYNRFNVRINNYLDAMEKLQLRRALQEVSFGLIQDLRWYERRCPGVERNNALYRYILYDWVKAIAPFTPHLCEEFWEKLGNADFVINQPLPGKKKVAAKLDRNEELLKGVIADIEAIKKLSGIATPKRIVLYASPPWKWDALEQVLKACEKKPDLGKAMQAAMDNERVKKQGRAVEGFVKAALKRLDDYRGAERIDEFDVLTSARNFLQKEFNCEILVEAADTASFDPAKKAQHAMPLKPAIYVE